MPSISKVQTPSEAITSPDNLRVEMQLLGRQTPTWKYIKGALLMRKNSMIIYFPERKLVSSLLRHLNLKM